MKEFGALLMDVYAVIALCIWEYWYMTVLNMETHFSVYILLTIGGLGVIYVAIGLFKESYRIFHDDGEEFDRHYITKESQFSSSNRQPRIFRNRY